jgi:hypothetical protein
MKRFGAFLVPLSTVMLIFGCGGPSSPPANNADTAGKADVQVSSSGPAEEHPAVVQNVVPSEDQKLAEQAKADAMKKFAEDAAKWPSMQASAADPKAKADATAAGNTVADRLLAEDKAAAAKMAQQPAEATVSPQEALDRANALIRASATKLGQDKKANDKSWLAPPPEATPPAAAAKPQTTTEKKSPSNKPAGKKAADKKPADKKPAN